MRIKRYSPKLKPERDPLDVAQSDRTLLAPRSIAVVGASDDPNRVGGRPIHFLQRFGYEGAVYPINPKRETVQGLTAYRDLAALPESPDLVVVVVPSDAVEAVIDDCVSRSVPYAVIISSGFGETGDAGRRVQDAMVERARRGGLRLLGPNAQGIANFRTGAIANFSTIFMELPPKDGPIAIVSQSGALSQMLYTYLRQAEFGIRYMTASGNDADLSAADILHMVLDDGEIRIVLLYLEAMRNVPALSDALERARHAGVSVIALKTGASERGRKSAMSHTGALATEDGVTRAFLRSHGAWQVDGVRQMVEAIPFYLRGRDAGSGRVGVLSHSGAVGVICADTADRLGLPIADLDAGTQDRLGEILPSYGAIENPVDMTAGLIGGGSMFRDTIGAVANDPNVDVVHVGMPVAGPGYDVTGFAAATVDLEQETGKPIAVSAPQESVRKLFTAAGAIVYDDDVSALTAVHQYVAHQALLAHRPAKASPMIIPVDGYRAGLLDESESLGLLSSAGLPTMPFTVCRTVDDAADAFAAYGGAVVVKGCSAKIPHKSEHGLVQLSLDAVESVREAAADCLERMAAIDMDGRLLVAPMCRGRHEVVVGAKRDPAVGPVIMVGDGGKYVEALKDTVLLVPPFSIEDVLEAMAKLRIWPVLQGVRGEAPMNIRAAAEIATTLANLMLGTPEIESVDMNPVILRDDGEEPVILDALITLAERTPS